MAERRRYIDVDVPIMDTTMKALGTAEQLDNKTIKLDMTRQLRGKGLTITLRIFNQEGKLVSFPKKLELAKSYIQRMMRKRVDYVEDSFKARCKDIRVIVKPLLITRKRVSRAVRKNLRNTAKEFILEYLKDKDYIEVCNDLLEGDMQKAMLPKLKKIYPLSFSDIRVFETKELEKIDMKKAAERTIMASSEQEIEAEDIQGVEAEKETSQDEEKETAEEAPAKEEITEQAPEEETPKKEVKKKATKKTAKKEE